MGYDYLAWLRAKKNTADLEKTNPQNPVLKDDDEQFLHKITSQEAAEDDSSPTADEEDQAETEADDDQNTASEETPTKHESESAQPDESTAKAEEEVKTGTAEPDESTSKAQDSTATASEPVVEGNTDAEKGDKEEDKSTSKEEASGEKSQQKKSTWVSYVPSLSWSKKDKETQKASTGSKEEAKSDAPSTADDSASKPDTHDLPDGVKITEDVKVDEKVDEKVNEKDESGLPPGVRITENVKLDQHTSDDEKEVSVLLDKLHLSSLNNRVFAFSDKTQKLYADFTIVLKDMINGVPTAYDDMEQLIKQNEGHLDELFGGLPPVIQGLVKSLPGKFGSTMGPEVFAATASKPSNDLRSKLQAASKSPTMPSPMMGQQMQQKKRSDSSKEIAPQRSMITSMLSNIVNFLKTRFPFLLTTTNVAMTLSTFILLLVFWYSHKRGKEVRLAKEAAAEGKSIDGAGAELDDGEVLEEKIEGDEEAALDDEKVAEPTEDEPVEEIDAAAESENKAEATPDVPEAGGEDETSDAAQAVKARLNTTTA